MAQKVYPDWVQEQRTKGTTVKKSGNNYYLYKHTSRRVRGKKPDTGRYLHRADHPKWGQKRRPTEGESEKLKYHCTRIRFFQSSGTPLHRRLEGSFGRWYLGKDALRSLLGNSRICSTFDEKS